MVKTKMVNPSNSKDRPKTANKGNKALKPILNKVSNWITKSKTEITITMVTESPTIWTMTTTMTAFPIQWMIHPTTTIMTV